MSRIRMLFLRQTATSAKHLQSSQIKRIPQDSQSIRYARGNTDLQLILVAATTKSVVTTDDLPRRF